MTAAQHEEGMEVLELEVEHREPIAFLVHVADTDTMLKVLVPKKAWFLQWGGALDADNPLAMAGLVNAFLDDCFDTKSSTYLHGRLNDNTDSFDVDELEPILIKLQELIAPTRPTGRRGGSSRQRPRSGTSSTVRSGGKGSTRKR